MWPEVCMVDIRQYMIPVELSTVGNLNNSNTRLLLSFSNIKLSISA